MTDSLTQIEVEQESSFEVRSCSTNDFNSLCLCVRAAAGYKRWCWKRSGSGCVLAKRYKHYVFPAFSWRAALFKKRCESCFCSTRIDGRDVGRSLARSGQHKLPNPALTISSHAAHTLNLRMYISSAPVTCSAPPSSNWDFASFSLSQSVKTSFGEAPAAFPFYVCTPWVCALNSKCAAHHCRIYSIK